MNRASAFAPGRVELLGNHTDYNEGVVLGAAIERGLTVCGSRRDDGRIRLESSSLGTVELEGPPTPPLRESRKADYVLGVAHELTPSMRGFSLEISGDLPAGAGLSSSAALSLATALVCSNSKGARCLRSRSRRPASARRIVMPGCNPLCSIR